MKHTVAAYKDVDTQKFNTPFYAPFSAKDLAENVKDGTIKGKIDGAESYELYHLGSYETETGKFELLSEPVKLLVLADYVHKE